MKKLNLAEWSSLAEVVASGAVVISLIFVGYSLRQNSHTLQATNDSLIFEIQDSVMSEISGNPEIASILIRLERGEEITDIEAKQWEWHLWRWLALWELAFNRYTEGLMDDSRWTGWNDAFKMIMLDASSGLTLELWQADRGAYGSDFAAHVDAAYSERLQD